MLEAIREVDPAIRFYQASSSEIFGEPRETPQTEETAPSPLTPYGVAKTYAHFIASSYRRRYGMFTCCGILYNHESPLRPVDFLPRKVARAAAAISLGLERELVLGDLSARRDWGYAGRLRARDVADAPARRAGRLRRRDGRVALGRGARRVRVRRRVPRLARPRAQRPVALSAARPSSTTSSATRRRHGACSAGSRRCASSELMRMMVEADRRAASGGERRLVDAVVGARGGVPGEALPRARGRAARSSSARSSASTMPAAIDAGVARVEEDGRVADHLGQRAGVGRGDRAAAGHRLDRRQPEALVEAREDERGGAPIERDELVASRRRRASRPRSGSRAGSCPTPVSTSRSSGRSARTRANASNSRAWFLCGQGRAG